MQSDHQVLKTYEEMPEVKKRPDLLQEIKSMRYKEENDWKKWKHHECLFYKDHEL